MKMKFHLLERPHKEENSPMDQEAKMDLSEFGVESDAPDLFNSSKETETLNPNELLSSENDDQEDDLEIPAFLRRQRINGLQKNKWKPPQYRMT